MKEGKFYFSGKHKIYGRKVEVSVLPNRLALHCSKIYPGSVSDLTILNNGMDEHKKLLSNPTIERSYEEDGNNSEKFPKLGTTTR